MAPKLKNYYDRHVKPLNPINLGESVRVRLPGEKVWSPAECVDFSGPRSYLVKTGDGVYRRNRRDLLSAGKTPVTDQFDSPVTPQSSRSKQNPLEQIYLRLMYLSQVCPLFLSQCQHPSNKVDRKLHLLCPFLCVPPTNLRRSQRERRSQKRFQDFVLN